MFMRYRGGGIGHMYMRAIEQIYENMSRERNHHKTDKRKSTRPNKDVPIGDDEDGMEDETPATATNIGGVETLTGDALDDDSDDNSEYFPDSDS